MTTTNRLLGSAALATLAAAAPVFAETFLVTSLAPSGEGSLASALAAASAASDPSVIMIADGPGEILLTEGLVYTGPAPLTLVGNGTTLRTDEDVTLLTTTATSELNLIGLQLVGPGEWSIENRADADGTAGKGLFVDVPQDATGTVTVRLTDVYVADVAGHGIHISDCTLADECGGGEGGGGDGSAASVLVEVQNLGIESVGFGRFDSDGLRVDERGPGSVTLIGFGLTAEGVGADGVELDEGQDGDVIVDLLHSSFTDNGAYCDPELLAAFMPDVDEDDFDEGEMAADAIPGPITGSPDDACIEREVDLYDDGSVEAYEFSIDTDDGLDIDEAGPGWLQGSFTGGSVVGNLDEGFDFDEAGEGSIDVTFIQSFGTGNTDDALKLSEEDGGTVYLVVTSSEFLGNGGVGIVAEEEGRGDLQVAILGTATSGNDGGDLGIEAVQEDAGEGAVYVLDSEIADGIETDGAALDAD